MRAGVVAVFAGLAALTFGGRAVAQGSSGSGSKPSETQVVLATMRGFNRLEARLGRLAARDGGSVDVRRYGERLYRDHDYANQEVTNVVHADRLTLPSPKDLPAASKLAAIGKRAGQLRQAKGEQFDRSFLQIVVQSQQMAIHMLKTARAELPAGKARLLVSEVVPILEQHVELAREMEDGKLPA